MNISPINRGPGALVALAVWRFASPGRAALPAHLQRSVRAAHGQALGAPRRAVADGLHYRVGRPAVQRYGHCYDPQCRNLDPGQDDCEEQLSTHRSVLQFDGVLKVTVPIDTPLLTYSDSALLAVTGSNFATSASATGTVKVVRGFNAQSTAEVGAFLYYYSKADVRRAVPRGPAELARSIFPAPTTSPISATVRRHRNDFLHDRAYMNPPGVPTSSSRFLFR